MQQFRRLGLSLFAIGVWTSGACSVESQTEQAQAEGPPVLKAVSAPSLSDIHPVSGNRLPPISREELDPFGQALYDGFVEAGRPLSGLQRGPRGIRMHSPKVAEYMTLGNQYLRGEAGFDRRLVELATLVAARAMDSQYEWTSHEPNALEAGLEPEIIDIIKHKRPVTGLVEKDAVVIQLGREALVDHRVSSQTFERALSQFGKKGLVDLVSLMAHYTATAVLLTTFNQQISPDRSPLLPVE